MIEDDRPHRETIAARRQAEALRQAIREAEGRPYGATVTEYAAAIAMEADGLLVRTLGPAAARTWWRTWTHDHAGTAPDDLRAASDVIEAQRPDPEHEPEPEIAGASREPTALEATSNHRGEV